MEGEIGECLFTKYYPNITTKHNKYFRKQKENNI